MWSLLSLTANTFLPVPTRYAALYTCMLFAGVCLLSQCVCAHVRVWSFTRDTANSLFNSIVIRRCRQRCSSEYKTNFEHDNTWSAFAVVSPTPPCTSTAPLSHMQRQLLHTGLKSARNEAYAAAAAVAVSADDDEFSY